VRKTEADTLLITNGFSCHEQIRQLGGRDALHLAEVLHLAMKEGTEPPPTEKERARYRFEQSRPSNAATRNVVGVGLSALAIAAVASISRPKRARKYRSRARR
jgi:hypothetical protein